MNFEHKREFFVIETIADDGQYLCEYLIDTDSGNASIHNTTRNIYSKAIKTFSTLDSAKEVLELIKNAKYTVEPRVLKIKTKLSIEEA